MIFSLSLLSLIVPLLANGARVQTSPRDNAVVAGSYIIELDASTSEHSKRAGDQVFDLLSSVLTHLAQPVTATIDSLNGDSPSSTSQVHLPKFSKRRTYSSLPHVFAGAVVAAEDVATNSKGEEAKWEDVVKGLETIKGVKVSLIFSLISFLFDFRANYNHCSITARMACSSRTSS